MSDLGRRRAAFERSLRVRASVVVQQGNGRALLYWLKEGASVGTREGK